jgi:hypothetical protein
MGTTDHRMATYEDLLAAHEEGDRVVAPPFESVEIGLAALWA